MHKLKHLVLKTFSKTYRHTLTEEYRRPIYQKRRIDAIALVSDVTENGRVNFYMNSWGGPGDHNCRCFLSWLGYLNYDGWAISDEMFIPQYKKKHVTTGVVCYFGLPRNQFDNIFMNGGSFEKVCAGLLNADYCFEHPLN